ncbi:GNAT family N-acetyltransferase [Deinococcus sp. KNUC1210]|uniref:GNAT family N-acetyltransferase n=1 Tax=Deinococcus sp. KNUC1210 TaxID=2917691 RepID=UPI001EF06C12|nr:GNAT family N-acetyltransferase [Deinococcus sp. KNUC1210]ULH14789.1 GNAT family N-acetyltransferase [Deinococcus sp. KNUC1210]
MLEFRPMTDQTFQQFLAHTVPQYAAEKVRSGEWSAQEAQARGEGEFTMLLPQGVNTPQNILYDLYDSDSAQNVGVLWYALRQNGPQIVAFVYEIEIYPDHRRLGHATRAFELLEQDAAKHGAGSVQLHVFGHNHGARALYERLGFFPTNLILRKNL